MDEYQEEYVEDDDYENGTVSYAVNMPAWLIPAAIGVLIGAAVCGVIVFLYIKMKK